MSFNLLRCTAIAAVTGIVMAGAAANALGAAFFNAHADYNGNPSHVSYSDSDENDTAIQWQSWEGPVEPWIGGITDGHSLTHTSGYANAASLAQGVEAAAVSTPTNYVFSDVYTYSEVSNTLTILPGSSGLSLGETILLTLNVSFDGSLTAASAAWPNGGGAYNSGAFAHADIDAGISVLDTDDQELAFFGASSEVEAYAVYKPVWNYTHEITWEEYWRGGSNFANEDFVHDDSGNVRQTMGGNFTKTLSLNTGSIALQFRTSVGETLSLQAYMSSYVNATYDAQARTDFLNTFAANVTSSVQGLDLAWNVVPEPASMTLLTIALLPALSRRRK